jgi:hypothetical protein
MKLISTLKYPCGYELTDDLRERIRNEQFRESVYSLISYVCIPLHLN